MLSGGSPASWSVTCAATTVTVQRSPPAKSTPGLSVKVVGPPVTTAVCAPLVAQETVNQLPATFTGSLKVMLMSALVVAPVAPFAGVVDETAGGVSTVQE